MTPQTTTSSPVLWLKASPKGTRAGFAVLPDGAGGRVTITVLPKPWGPRGTVVRQHDHPPGTTTHLVIYETELIALSTAARECGFLARGIADLARTQPDLLGLGTPPRKAVHTALSVIDPFSALIDLMLLAERGRLSQSPLTFEGTYASSIVRLITHERLLRALEPLIFRARPRYAERTEVLEVPRGRLGERSLIYSIATGVPRVESTFDELTMDTPLLRVIASALRVVASERLPLKVVQVRPGLQARAIYLLRYMTSVGVIHREQALLDAGKLWLGPLDRPWRPAIDAAIPVLRDQAVLPEDGSEESEAFLVEISTEKFWEQCLELALENGFTGTLSVSREGQPGEGVNVPGPWGRHPSSDDSSAGAPPSERLPDFMFRTRYRTVVADAKYKLNSGKVPSSQDGYQLFAYSHLARFHGTAPDVAVILYPARTDAPSGQFELARLRENLFPLWLVQLPFPDRADLHSHAQWSNFVARLTHAIREFSVEWSTSAPPAESSDIVEVVNLTPSVS